MILVIGGTGLVGSRVVEGLLGEQRQVKVLSAGLSEWSSQVVPMFRKAGVAVLTGDICDQRTLAEAVEGCTGIVHAAGIMHDRHGQSLEMVNSHSMASLIPIAENAGVQRLVYVSCLGATQFSSSRYFQTKWQAETLVRQGNFAWTIFRPALIFGPGCHLLRGLEYWAKRLPVVLTIGSGLNEVAMVSAEDVAACITQAIYNRDTVGQTYNLVGPESMTLAELMEHVSFAATGKVKPMLKIPAPLGYRLADLFATVNARCPVSGEFMKIISSDLSGDPAIMQKNFQVAALSLASSYQRLGNVDQSES